MVMPQKPRPLHRRGCDRKLPFLRPKVLASHYEMENIVKKNLSFTEDAFVSRPKTRGDCQCSQRPCPWVGCRYHLYLEVTESGSLLFRFPHLKLWELKETCALDVAERGEKKVLEEIGLLMNLTRERVRQIEKVALKKFYERLETTNFRKTSEKEKS